MIKDDLTLDGTPTLNLASFVTTYMVGVYGLLASQHTLTGAQEEEAEKLMVYVEQTHIP
jgi:glutamate/tyrosine decarboxylase-like PLP-dependent enzyme